MRIGILGGTFDPIHIGHLRLAIEAKEQLSLDIVLFIPAYIPPHKLGYAKKQNAHIRCTLIKKTIQSFSYMKLCQYEIKQKKISYTIDTISFLQNTMGKEHQFFLLLGSDWNGHLDSWKKSEQLQNEVTIVMAKRTEKVQITNDVKILNMPVINISSTLIREKLKKKEDIHGLVSDKIVSILKKQF